MINERQIAIIKKDLRGIVLDKNLFPPLLIVPAMFVVFIPTLFIMLIHFGLDDMQDMQGLLMLLQAEGASQSDPLFVIEALLNYIMPVFFMIIPIMASMIMAASSFVGEKENRTLETLLYSPLPLKKIFQAKILAAFLLSALISLGSFFVMLVVVETELLLIAGKPYIPNLSWLVNLLLVSPAISLISVTLIVRGSAKAQTVQESQQRAVFLIVPVFLLLTGQFTGLVLIGPLLLLCIGLFFALIAALLLRGAAAKYTYEALLK